MVARVTNTEAIVASNKRRALPVQDRFWAKVERTDRCWLWTAGLDAYGYGQFYLAGGTMVKAHRFAWELELGPIPRGLTLDHLCRVRHCCRPSHLEPVTSRENVQRGVRHRRPQRSSSNL